MKKMISSIVLLALVSSMIFSSIPVSVYADSQSDSLIRIASQARDQVKIQLSKVDVTQEIKEKFELGSEHIELLIEAVKNEDVATARQHFLSAMTIFNEIIQQISERTVTSEAALSDSSPSVDTSRIAHEVDRLERYIDQLKRIAVNNGFDLDSSLSDNLIEKARKIIPGVSFSTDIIAGFPTETYEDHIMTLDIMREVRYDGAYMFKYSPREGTKAYRMQDDVSEETKSKRLHEIIDLQQQISYECVILEELLEQRLQLQPIKLLA